MSKWKELKTKHGYAADEVISAVQKSIRQGREDDAVFFAYELLCSGGEFEEKCWERLRVISVEDIGLANPSLVSTIYALYKNYVMLARKDREDKFLQAMLAILLLVRSPKSRYVDELYNNLQDKVELENYRREIFDDVLDKHTKRGKEMGRDFRHFWEESSKLKSDMSTDKHHLKEILQRLDKSK